MSYDVLETYEVEGFYTRYDKFYVKCKPVKTTWLQRLFGKSCLYFELVISQWSIELKKSNQVWASENKDTLALPVSSWYLYSLNPAPLSMVSFEDSELIDIPTRIEKIKLSSYYYGPKTAYIHEKIEAYISVGDILRAGNGDK